MDNRYAETTFPIEGLGFIILDDNRITISMHVIQSLIDNNAAVVFCDSKHYPKSLLLNLDGNHIQSDKDQTTILIPHLARKMRHAPLHPLNKINFNEL